MNSFTKLFSSLTLASAIALPALATNYGWGIGTEKNAKLIGEIEKSCPAQLRTPDGKCRRSHRSFFGTRSGISGGPRSGK